MKFRSLTSSMMLGSALALVVSSCVEIPSEGHVPPDYHSQVRFVNAGAGVDTIALLQYSVSWKAPLDTTDVTIGSDIIRVIRDTSIAHSTYTRLMVDFAQDWELLIDNSSKGSISVGGATTYLDLPSGSRNVKLQGTGTLIDSLAIKDTTIIVRTDTIRTTGTVTVEDIMELPHNFFFPLTGTITEVLDSVDGALIIFTESKGTVFLIGDTVAASTQRDNLVRFGRISYLYAGERYTFAPPGVQDTALVRFTHASANVGAPIDVSVLLPTGDLQATLEFSQASSYLSISTVGSSSYVFYVINTQTSALVDSVVIPVSSGKRYTTVIYDSDSLIVATTLTDD